MPCNAINTLCVNISVQLACHSSTLYQANRSSKVIRAYNYSMASASEKSQSYSSNCEIDQKKTT